MQGVFVVIGIFLGLSSMVESKIRVSGGVIDKLIEKKVESVMKTYDRKIALLEDKIHSQERKINSQENKIQTLEEKCSGQLMDAEDEKKEASTDLYAVSNRSKASSLQKDHELKRSAILNTQKRIVPGAADIVAFCAYMSTTEHNPSLHHIFVFDDVKTNIGSPYNKYSGMFTAPSDGVYVFTWTIFTPRHSYAYCQIVINSQAFTGMVTDSETVTEIHSTTGVIAVSLNRGDLVHIRTHPTSLSHGDVSSNDISGRASFCGWKL